MEFKKTIVRDLTPVEYNRCKELTFGDEGDLIGWMNNDPNADVVLAIVDGEIVGWGMRRYAPPRLSTRHSTGYFVDPKWRGRGIGTQLFYRLNPDGVTTRVYPHDKVSAAFFYAVNMIDKATALGWNVDVKNVSRKSRKRALTS